MSVEKKIRLHWQSLTIEIDSSYAAFMRYLRKQFFFHFSEDSDGSSAPDLRVQLSWEKGSLKKILIPRESGFRRIATNAYLSDKECVYLDKINGRRTRVNFVMEGRQISVSAVQEEKRYRSFFKRDDEDWMRRACYHFIYCPVFFFLQHFYGKHPLHAGAFRVSGKTVVIAGLDKMGKTTLSLHGSQIQGAAFLSDNIIFHDRGTIASCYTPVKIRGEGAHGVPADFRQIARIQGQSYFAPPASSEDSFVPDVIIIPCFSEEPFLKGIPAASASAVIMNINMLASEIKEYLGAATFWNLMVEGEPLCIRQSRDLTELLKSTKCYQIGIGRKEFPQETIARVVDLIRMEGADGGRK